MTVLFETIDELSGGRVEFYTVKLGDKAQGEFFEFDEKEFPNHLEEHQILYSVIAQMVRRGAKRHYFKFEENANALPIVSEAIMAANNEDYGIRLYCIRISDEKVVLLNGGIKTKRDPTECPNVRAHFNRARRIGTILNKAIADDDITITDPWCLEQFTIEI